jgi:hypothetical protein
MGIAQASSSGCTCKAQRAMILLSLLQLVFVCQRIDAFSTSPWSSTSTSREFTFITSNSRATSTSSSTLYAAKCSALPSGLSPFEKSVAKSLDVQGSFRKLAGPALEKAIAAGATQLELDFPPLIGGDQSKTQFDDFDNVSELNSNRDWCVQLLPTLSDKQRDIWFVLPDDKECELACTEWTGQRFRKAAKFTSIRAATCATAGDTGYTKAWGSSIASTVNKMTGGDGILADSSTLDDLDNDADDDVTSSSSSTSTGLRLHLVCQPGNGGPVEDWINVERLHKASTSASPPVTCIVNGALDKVRDGYYAAVFFPALARTVPFYKQFEAVFVLKPLSDKGLYGWLYRVYPEPWQVVLQTARQVQKGDETVVKVENTVALVSDKRPSYQEALKAMLATAANQNVKQ